MEDDRTYCMVPGCDEQPRPGDEVCETHHQEAAAEYLSSLKPIVKLVGEDSNAFMIIGLCRRAAQKAKWSTEKWDAVLSDMMSGDYDHVLQVAMTHFEVE